MHFIKRIASICPNAGLELSSKNTRYEEILALFSPTWIATDAGGGTINALAQHRGLQSLFLEDAGVSDLGRLPAMPNLHELSVGFADTTSTVEGLERYSSVKNLSITHSGLAKTEFVRSFRELRSLVLMSEKPLDIEAVSNCRKLQTLVVSSIVSLDPIKKLHSLTQLGFPPNTTQQQFADIVQSLPRLEIISFTPCREIVDLHPLTGLKNLHTLYASDTLRDYTPLYGSKTLRILTVPDDIFSDSMIVAFNELQSNLPNCKIEPGVCMGSGWLLLLFPGVLASQRAFAYWRRKKSPAVGSLS